MQRAIEYLAISMLPIALMVISVYKGLVGSIGVLSLAYSVFLLIGCRSDRHSRGSESPVTGKGVEFY